MNGWKRNIIKGVVINYLYYILLGSSYSINNVNIYVRLFDINFTSKFNVYEGFITNLIILYKIIFLYLIFYL